MKYIQKGDEPLSLKIYREKTPNSSYNGFSDKKIIRETLLKEQGHICAYCMKRISLDLNNYYKPKTEIEHYLSQKNFPEKDLDYTNILGVCNGNSNGILHCDKSKNNLNLKILNPLKLKTSEHLINYTLSGLIVSKSNNLDVKHDINKILNLNNDKLIQFRNDALDKAKKDFIKQNPKKQWTKKMFDNEIEKYKIKVNGKYKPFCNFIIWYFEKQKNKNKYQ